MLPKGAPLPIDELKAMAKQQKDLQRALPPKPLPSPLQDKDLSTDKRGFKELVEKKQDELRMWVSDALWRLAH